MYIHVYIPCKHIRVMCSLESFFKLFQLKAREGCSVAPLLPLPDLVTIKDVGAVCRCVQQVFLELGGVWGSVRGVFGLNVRGGECVREMGRGEGILKTWVLSHEL